MRRYAFAGALIVLASLASSCDDGDMAVQTHEYNSRESGILDLDPVLAIVVANELGPVIIEGGSDTSSIRWFLDKNVSAGSQAQADQLFPQLSIKLQTLHDSAFISLNSVPDADFSSSSLSLTLPYWIPCTLRRVSGAAVVSYLRSTFTGEQVGNTTIVGHEGNCFLTGAKGKISVELALPDSGLCKITMDEGDILLKIPASTSSFLSVTIGEGVFTYSGLVISEWLGSTPPHALRGKMGTGRGLIQMATGRGNINLVGL